MDRETARANLTTALMRGALVAGIFALCFVVAILYIAQ